MEQTTITISRRTKRRLEMIKGKKSWDELLNELYEFYIRLRRVAIAKEFEEKFGISDREFGELIRMVEESRKWRSLKT